MLRLGRDSGHSTLSDELAGRDRRAKPPPIAGRARSRCPSRPLDALIARHGTPDFVKIDVEGFEPQVLAGLSPAGAGAVVRVPVRARSRSRTAAWASSAASGTTSSTSPSASGTSSATTPGWAPTRSSRAGSLSSRLGDPGELRRRLREAHAGVTAGGGVDAVVVSYRSAATLRGCVEPLAAMPGVRVTVVDNASPDDARRHARGPAGRGGPLAAQRRLLLRLQPRRGARHGPLPPLPQPGRPHRRRGAGGARRGARRATRRPRSPGRASSRRTASWPGASAASRGSAPRSRRRSSSTGSGRAPPGPTS